MTERLPRRPLRAWGLIEALLPGHRCTVVMPNGYRADAHLDKSLRASPPVLIVGAPVYLEFSTYDLANPRMVLREKAELSPSSDCK
jgi:translation initiation factor IF-1